MNIFQLPLTRFWVAKKSETRLDFLFDFSDKASTAAQRKRGEAKLSCPAVHDERLNNELRFGHGKRSEHKLPGRLHV